MFARYPLFFLALLSLSPLAAQVEVNPYIGYLLGEDRLTVGEGGSVREFTGTRYAVGVDALLGARQLAPSGGLLYVHRKFSGDGGTDFSYGSVHLPLGLAYRVLPPDFDLNLVANLAVAPGWVAGGGTAPGFEGNLDWSLRGGVRLYLDYVTLGVHYFGSFTDHYPPDREVVPQWMLTLGIRL
ncbi:hypothetical protein GGR26_002277 [Lewinella marina]|uniref:Outer membrane protein beta-barrel domain-containing protein n=1 Tax=Neolewinella marina TaxID=438751 RepID=A0A2G0CGC8_9BACT|nr:hypothetical protein [Neolewinella marina]NJB86509.1 hypothetical protein [Neolewinella marina]PHK99034.1 hypothetical protein CGL56_06125 [Neolewinella marina]